MTLLANTLSANVAASLAFNDQFGAENLLSGLNADGDIIAARLYDSSGQILAEYLRTHLPRTFTIRRFPPMAWS